MRKISARHIHLYIIVMAIMIVTSTSCDSDDPARESTPELITEIELLFTPNNGGLPIQAIATDPDGEGVQDIEVDGPIQLQANTTYQLQIQLHNTLVDETDPGYEITSEVEEEGAEHIFFFEFTTDAFSSPSGNGNIDNRTDAVNYEDEDNEGHPLGLITAWTTGAGSSGNFRILLKHQPGTKTHTSQSTVGETDLDVTFPFEISN